MAVVHGRRLGSARRIAGVFVNRVEDPLRAVPELDATGAPGLYRDPLVYDVLSTPGTAREVDGLERIVRLWVRSRGARRDWLEPGCGTGRYLRILARRGFRVTGFDHSIAMIEYAQRRAAAARLFAGDFGTFASRCGRLRYDFAFNLFNSIRHLESDAAMLAHFAGMARVLRPGGIYAVGLSFTDYGHEPMDEDIWEARRGGLHVRQVVQYLPPGTWPAATRRTRRFERVVSHVTVERGAVVSHFDSTYDLRTYNALEWRRLVARSALGAIATVTWNGARVADRVMPYAIELLGRRADAALHSRPAGTQSRTARKPASEAKPKATRP